MALIKAIVLMHRKRKGTEDSRYLDRVIDKVAYSTYEFESAKRFYNIDFAEKYIRENNLQNKWVSHTQPFNYRHQTKST